MKQFTLIIEKKLTFDRNVEDLPFMVGKKDARKFLTYHLKKQIKDITKDKLAIEKLIDWILKIKKNKRSY